MNRTEFIQAMTLWFVALLFLQTDSGGSEILFLVIATIALGVVVVMPLYLIFEVAQERFE